MCAEDLAVADDEVKFVIDERSLGEERRLCGILGGNFEVVWHELFGEHRDVLVENGDLS